MATDDSRVLAAMESCGGKALMTAKDHPTGTDRLAEVAGIYDNYDVIINVQGDEPLIAQNHRCSGRCVYGRPRAPDGYGYDID